MRHVVISVLACGGSSNVCEKDRARLRLHERRIGLTVEVAVLGQRLDERRNAGLVGCGPQKSALGLASPMAAPVECRLSAEVLRPRRSAAWACNAGTGL